LNTKDIKTRVYHITYFPKSKVACLYFYGCNFQCRGCIRRRCNFDIHLPPSKQNGADKRKKVFLTAGQVLNALSKEKIKKLIFMGGEPTIDSNLALLTRELKEKLNTDNTLLTNGYRLPDVSFLDEICVGIKTKSSRLHRDYTGKNSERVFRNIKMLAGSGVTLRAECVFIPGYIDAGEISRIAQAISKIDANIPLRIDAYIPVPGMGWKRPRKKEMKEVVDRAKKYLKDVTFLAGNGKADNKRKSSDLVKVLV